MTKLFTRLDYRNGQNCSDLPRYLKR